MPSASTTSADNSDSARRFFDDFINIFSSSSLVAACIEAGADRTAVVGCRGLAARVVLVGPRLRGIGLRLGVGIAGGADRSTAHAAEHGAETGIARPGQCGAQDGAGNCTDR